MYRVSTSFALSVVKLKLVGITAIDIIPIFFFKKIIKLIKKYIIIKKNKTKSKLIAIALAAFLFVLPLPLALVHITSETADPSDRLGIVD